MPVTHLIQPACQTLNSACLSNSSITMPVTHFLNEHPWQTVSSASLSHNQSSIPVEHLNQHTFQTACQKLLSALLSTAWSRLPARYFTPGNHLKPTSRSTRSFTIPRKFNAVSCHRYSASLSTTQPSIPVKHLVNIPVRHLTKHSLHHPCHH